MSRLSQIQPVRDYYRQCPGESGTISDAVCTQRRKHHYPKCPGCRWNDAESAQLQGAGTMDMFSPHQIEVHMIEKVFKAYDIRGIYPEPLNEEISEQVPLHPLAGTPADQ